MVESQVMAPRWNIFAVVASLAMFGCAGTKHEAKAVETNPWADFKGTYAPGAPATVETKPVAAAAKSSSSSNSSSSSAESKTASAETKPSKTGKAVKPTTSAAESKPATAEPKAIPEAPKAEVKTAVVKPVLAASDPRSLYGVDATASAKPDDDDAELVPVPKATKKRGAGKKAGAKKAPGARPKKK